MPKRKRIDFDANATDYNAAEFNVASSNAATSHAATSNAASSNAATSNAATSNAASSNADSPNAASPKAVNPTIYDSSTLYYIIGTDGISLRPADTTGYFLADTEPHCYITENGLLRILILRKAYYVLVQLESSSVDKDTDTITSVKPYASGLRWNSANGNYDIDFGEMWQPVDKVHAKYVKRGQQIQAQYLEPYLGVVGAARPGAVEILQQHRSEYSRMYGSEFL